MGRVCKCAAAGNCGCVGSGVVSGATRCGCDHCSGYTGRVMRWLVLLLCFSVAHAAVADLDILRDTGTGFARAVEPRTFEFPRDHGPHPDFHHEWWYVT